ncbi:MAG: Oligopeptide transport ATP-binding protein OppD, partial [uncultured Nocardioidaceae bacterium]
DLRILPGDVREPPGAAAGGSRCGADRRGPLPGRRPPVGAVPDPRRARPGGQRPLLHRATWADARHRGRVRVRQERLLDGGAQPPQPQVDEAGGIDHRRRPGGRRRRRRDDAQAAGQGGRDDLPGPVDRPPPVLHRRPADHGGVPHPCRRLEVHREEAGDRDARPGGHPAGAEPRRRLPAPVLRRDAAARDDRDVAGQRPQAAHRRRTDHGARRHGPGADPRPASGPAAGVQLRDHHHHPRPRRHRRDGRRRPGHVRRPGGGDRSDEAAAHRAGDALHLGPAVQRPRRRRRHRRPADPHPRQPPEPSQPALGLPLQPSVRLQAEGARRAVRHHAARAAPGEGGTRPPATVPPAGSARDLPPGGAAGDRAGAGRARAGRAGAGGAGEGGTV